MHKLDYSTAQGMRQCHRVEGATCWGKEQMWLSFVVYLCLETFSVPLDKASTMMADQSRCSDRGQTGERGSCKGHEVAIRLMKAVLL